MYTLTQFTSICTVCLCVPSSYPLTKSNFLLKCFVLWTKTYNTVYCLSTQTLNTPNSQSLKGWRKIVEEMSCSIIWTISRHNGIKWHTYISRSKDAETKLETNWKKKKIESICMTYCWLKCNKDALCTNCVQKENYRWQKTLFSPVVIIFCRTESTLFSTSFSFHWNWPHFLSCQGSILCGWTSGFGSLILSFHFLLKLGLLCLWCFIFDFLKRV